MVINAGNYQVTVGQEWSARLKHLLVRQQAASVFILCDSNTLLNCLPVLIKACPQLGEAEIIETEPGEQSKSLAIAEQIWLTLSEMQAGREMLLINLGGGVISDLGGFCASVYKRGVRFLNIPTSLLAMADASVGAKNGIDFNGIKNMIGSFSEPSGVFVNPEFLHTLPERQFKSGLSEIYKMSLISDASFWKILTGQKAPGIHTLISKSIALKNRIVQKDPLDTGVRKILNFGHTAGHAIESASFGTADELLHGEAILAGMIIEAHLSWQKKLLSKKELDKITGAFREKFTLPDLGSYDTSVLIGFMRNDKKNIGGGIKFSLLSGIGSCLTGKGATEIQVQRALEFYNLRVYGHD